MRWNVVGTTISYKIRTDISNYDISTKQEIPSSIPGIRLVVCQKFLSTFNHKDACEMLFETSLFTLEQAEKFVNSMKYDVYSYYESEVSNKAVTEDKDKDKVITITESSEKQNTIDIKEAMYPSSDFVVDRKNRMLKGVSIGKLKSRNNRKYLKEAFQNAKNLYESAPFFIDHNPKEDSRSPRDFGGKFVNIRDGIDSKGDYVLKGDVLVLEKEDFLLEVAERMPEALGFSHHAQGVMKIIEGEETIVKLVKVNSIDLVCNPATTTSLYENVSVSQTKNIQEKTMEILSAVTTSEAKPAEKVKAELTVSTLQESYPLLYKEVRKDLEVENLKLKTELDIFVVKEKIQQKESFIAKTLKEFEIKDSDVTATFMEILRESDSDAKVKRLVQDRKDLLAQRTTPLSSVKPSDAVSEEKEAAKLYEQIVSCYK